MIDDLSRIEGLIELHRNVTAGVREAKDALEAAQAELQRIETEYLPDLMRELGLADAKLPDGTKITLTDEVNAGVSEDRMPAAMAWLRERGYDGIVKTVVATEFGRGEAEAAEALAAQITEETGHLAAVKQTIHPSTLKSFVKERLAAGEAIPFDTFGIFPYTRAKVRGPR